MSTSIESYISTSKFDRGELKLLVSKMHDAASALGPSAAAPVLASLEAALASTTAYGQLAIAYDQRENAPTSRYSERVHALDSEIDAQLNALDAVLAAVAVTHDEASPEGAAARKVQSTIFPTGVSAVTRSSFVQQQERVTQIVALLDGALATDYQSAMVPDAFRSQLKSLATHMQQALLDDPTPPPSYDELRAAKDAAHRSLLVALANIFASYPDDTADQQAARTALLTPLAEATARRRASRRRGSSTDATPAAT